MGIYHPPNTKNKYVTDHLNKVIDFYSTKYGRIVIIGYFNLEPSTDHIENTCFKGPPKCYDLILTKIHVSRDHLNAIISS